MKNKNNYVINNAILIIGIIVIFHTYQKFTPLEFYIGKTILKLNKPNIHPLSSNILSEIAFKDALISNYQFNKKKYTYFKTAPKISTTVFKTCLITTKKKLFNSNHTFQSNLIIELRNLRI